MTEVPWSVEPVRAYGQSDVVDACPDADRLSKALAAILTVHAGVPDSYGLDQVDHAIVKAATDLVGARLGALVLTDPRTGRSRSLAGDPLSDEVGRIVTSPAVASLLEIMLREGAPLVVSETREHPAFQEIREDVAEPRSVVAVPLRARERYRGFLLLLDKSDGSPFVRDDAAMLAMFAEAAGDSVSHALALDEAHRGARWMEIGIDFTQRLLTTEQDQEVLEALADATGELVRCDMIAVVESLPETGEVLVRVSRGMGSESQEGFRFPASRSMSGIALSTGRQVVVEDVHASELGPEGGFAASFDPDHRLGPIVATPIQAAADALGVLVAGRAAGSSPFEPSAVSMLRSFAGRAAMAMELSSAKRAAAEAERRRIRELDQANQELRAALQRADEASRAKTDFLSRMSHELRTPLNSILGFAQLLEMEDLTEEMGESVHNILSGGRHLLELINDVLDVGRIESGRLALSMEAVPVASAVDSAVKMIEHSAARRNITIQASPELGELCVRADSRRLTQVILNLLSNAVKFTRRGGTVRVEAEPRGRFVAVSVSDDGPGIPEDRRSEVFKPFFRGAERGADGTGLGLSLARGFTEAMQGTLELEPKVGEGSTLTVLLHRAEPPAAAEEGEAKAADTGASTEESAALDRLIVYVEDNSANWELMARILRRRPHVRLLVAKSLAEWREVIGSNRPDLVLLDLHLPDGHGLQALNAIKGKPETREIPVVVVTADAMSEERRRMLEHGVVEYVTKPFDVAELLGIIDRWTA